MVELFSDFVEGDAVGDPDVGVDFALADEVDDFREIGGQGVAGGEQGEFAAVENRGVGELKIGGGDADIHHAAGEGGELETGGHGARGAGGVNDHVAEISVGEGFEIGEVRAVGFGEDAVFDAEVFRAEIQTALHHVHDDHVHAFHEFQELQASEADGAGTDDEDGFAGFRVAAMDGVVADGEGLDEGELVVGEVVAGVELAGGDDEGAFAETAVVVDTDYLDAGAAVGVALLRGRGFGIVYVGLERAFVAGFHIRHALADGDDLQPELVAGGAGVGEEGEFP